MNKFITMMFAAVLLALPIQAGAIESGAMAPDFTLTDSNGNEHSLSDFKGKHVVLEWVNYECPFVVKHYRSNNMQELQKEYTDEGVIWLSINSSAPGKQGHYTPDEINEIMANSKAAPTAYLIDESGEVGKMYSAKTTPHMYVIDPDGKLVYQGAIDSIPSFDMDDIDEADNYVAGVLDKLLAGESVEPSATQAYGCSVKY